MHESIKNVLRVWPWLAAVLSGLLCVGCFAPFNQSWLCWIALTPLISAVWFSGKNSKRRWLRNLLLGYVAGFIFFAGAFSWLNSLGILFENFWLRGLSLLLALYMGFYFAFWSWFIGLFTPADFSRSWKNLLIAFLAASAWTAHEWVRGWLFTGFGWNGLGVALHGSWPLIQVAEFTGVAGLSFAVAFTNVIAVTTPVRLFFEARTHKMRPHFDVTLSMVALMGLFAFGIHAAQNSHPTKSVRVAAVQANVPQQEKFDANFGAKIFDQFSRLSEIGLGTNPPPDLLIWPESSLPDPVRAQSTPSYGFVMDFSTAHKVDLLLGSIDFDDGRDYNAALLISGADQRIQIYRKIHLVPFGEYIPLRHSFPLFAAAAGTWVPGDFESGKDYTVFQLTNGDIKVAPLICFEDTVGELTRQFVINGANLLADVTNDGWFLHSAGSQQHLASAIFRCVETRRPMVRAANTGVTCFINELGQVTQILRDDTGSTFTEGVLTGEVNIPQDRQLTFYVRHGEVFAQGCAALTAVAVLLVLIRRVLSRL